MTEDGRQTVNKFSNLNCLSAPTVRREDRNLNERTPLVSDNLDSVNDNRTPLFMFLEAKTKAGAVYENFTILLIIFSVAAFITSSLFVPKYNHNPYAKLCGKVCDGIFFGNERDNILKFLNIGATCVLELFVIAVFTIDYVLRFYTADMLNPKYKGVKGRVRYTFTFFSLVDLASTVPFYVDSFLIPNIDVPSLYFLRMFRLLGMKRSEGGRFDLALTLLNDVFVEQSGILGVAGFVGFTVWAIFSSLYYLAERNNTDMIYCGAALKSCELKGEDEVITSLCKIDHWGIVDCSAAGCPNEDGKEVCWNVYRSILDSSYWTLVNLFGEYPLVDKHSPAGKVVGCFTTMFAVAVFALPVGIIGSGFEKQIGLRREEREASKLSMEEMRGSGWVNNVEGDESTLRGRLFNFLHLQNTPLAQRFDLSINILVAIISLAFMFDTLKDEYMRENRLALGVFELQIVIIFIVEYALRMYSIRENPAHRSFKGWIVYAGTFLPLVDLMSFAPYICWVIYTGNFVSPRDSDNTVAEIIVKFFWLVRLLRFEKHTSAFTTFDDVIRNNADVLSVTGFSALLMWILFSVIFYYTERNNPDQDIASYYDTIPNSMWITLLNLSGECPVDHYTMWGKLTMGVILIFATGLFGIPIGVLGAGFQELISRELEEVPEDPVDDINSLEGIETRPGLQAICYRFVNGIGSRVGQYFEISIYILIIITTTIGIIQTVHGQENTLSSLEGFGVYVFTLEYALRLIGNGADPHYEMYGPIEKRFRFIFSFYSLVDLLAIVPFYLVKSFPGSWWDKHNDYL